MPTSNLEWELIGQGLRKLQVGLLPFVNGEMIKCYGNDWLKHPNVARILQRKNQNREYHLDNLDIDALLDIIDDNQNWEKVFKSQFKRKHRGEMINLKDVRDRHAHPCSSNDFSLDEADQALYSMVVLLELVSANEADDVQQLRQEILRLRIERHTFSNLLTDQVPDQPNIDQGKAEPEFDKRIETTDTTLTDDLLTLPYSIPNNKPKVEPVPTEEDTSLTTFIPIDEPLPWHNSPIGKKVKQLLIAIGSVLALSVIGIGMKYVEFYLKPKIQKNLLIIGTLGSPKNQTDLADYLREQFAPSDFIAFLFRKRVKVIIEGDKQLSYQEAKNRIALKEWDIAFTLSPMISLAAKDNGYTFAARMFPDNPPYYYSGIFVKSDSSIRSIDDLKTKTVIALGDFNSASSFYMPTYDLFGKTLTVDMGHRGLDIVKIVKEGKADLGAAAIGDAVKEDDPEIRVIHKSRGIPGSGIYLSPNLSNSERETVKKVLLQAPTEVQKKANYGAGQEPDYSFFLGITRRSEEVLKCADFKQNPVSFFCSDTKQIALTSIVGQVKQWGHQNSNIDWMTLAGKDGQTYRVVISLQMRNQIPGASSLLALQGKDIKITGVSPQKLKDGTFELKITQPNQLAV